MVLQHHHHFNGHRILPHRFEIFIKYHIMLKFLKLLDYFIGPYQDVIYFHDYQTDLKFIMIFKSMKC